MDEYRKGKENHITNMYIRLSLARHYIHVFSGHCNELFIYKLPTRETKIELKSYARNALVVYLC